MFNGQSVRRSSQEWQGTGGSTGPSSPRRSPLLPTEEPKKHKKRTTEAVFLADGARDVVILWGKGLGFAA